MVVCCECAVLHGSVIWLSPHRRHVPPIRRRSQSIFGWAKPLFRRRAVDLELGLRAALGQAAADPQTTADESRGRVLEAAR